MRTLFFAFFTLILAGCGASAVDPSYAGTARYEYDQGVEALDDDDWVGAMERFTAVKNKFPYSQYAALAELRIGDTWYAQDKHLQAVDAYKLFVQSRPTHRDVPYALWRVGTAYYEQRPSDFFLFPPTFEKDQAATKDAVRSLEHYLERFPQDVNAADARQKLAECRRELARHEMYVADFYLRQERPASARGRLEGLVSEYEDLGDVWARAGALLVEVYLDLELPDNALVVARQVIEKQPASDEADEMRTFLRSIGKL
jgi:outer membrane protein assembly factor BamD